MFLAAPAHAATVTARDETDIDPHNGETHTRIVEFTAAPGETNRLLVDPYERYGVRLYDPAGITPQGLSAPRPRRPCCARRTAA